MDVVTSGVRARIARARRKITAYRDNDEGVAAIEFALLAIPFTVLLFAILELAMIFFINAALDHAASQASRAIRTGQLQEQFTSSDAQLREFRDIICENMSMFEGCDQKLSITLVVPDSGSFAPYAIPDRPYDPATESVPPDQFECTAPRDIVIARVEFYHDLVMPGNLTKLGSDPNDSDRHILSTTTVFRTEPFPPATCS